jgi:outer membrane receptor protein involved in Fe transport
MSCRLFLLTQVAVCAFAATGSIQGIVHDPQHRPLPGAQVVFHGESPVLTGPVGEFEIDAVPEGTYSIDISHPGFLPLTQQISVVADKTPVLHFQLNLAPVNSRIEVSGSRLDVQTSTVQTMVSPEEISHTPGADQTNSLAMITDFTPGAYMVHDMLHMRGGHQVNWFLDGIPVVNTNIAANVAPLINPKNVEELEVERGGYSSEYGDRTYGLFNVVTPSGFERNNEIDFTASAGNSYSTDDQVNIGSHTQRFAYYASFDGNRSELGLGAPVSKLIHDQESGTGGFVSLLWNPTAKDQFRWIASLREDHYQIPNDSDAQAAGARDLDLEKDYLGGFHWAHSFSAGTTFTLAPYFHYNNAQYIGGPQDAPFILNDNTRSNYAGARSTLQLRKKRNDATIGIEVWGQHDNSFFGLAANPGGAVLNQQQIQWASSEALFAEDQLKATSWLTFDLGLRVTHYSGLVSENAASPRIGASILIPHINWTLHGYYAYYYQPPPLDSLAGPSLDFAIAQGYGFTPLQGERDIQHDIGLNIPFGGWDLDVDTFHTSARNFLDHDVIGDSGVFIPLTDLGAIISGTETTIRSPKLFNVAQWRIAYSNQIGQGIGPVTGGLLNGVPSGNFLLDHDQRNTLTSVLALSLPGHAWATPTYEFGSGFMNGNGPSHLPPHSTFDLSIGKTFRENVTVSASAVNIANTRYLLDTSNTFGGTHYINPRQIYGEIKYRFHF